MEAIAILQPVMVVAVLTVVMTISMILTRAPAMATRGIDYQQVADTSTLRDLLPPEIMRVSNNYNHLLEQRYSQIPAIGA